MSGLERSVDDGASTVAATCRSYLMRLLREDVDYDEDPEGDPPLLVADYRRALLVLLTLDRIPLLLAGRASITPGEAAAFQAGQQAALDAVVVAISETWQPDRLARRNRHRPYRRRRDLLRAAADDTEAGREC